MTAAAIVTLLQTASLLLTQVQANPTLPQSFHDHATQVAETAIDQAHQLLSRGAPKYVAAVLPVPFTQVDTTKFQKTIPLQNTSDLAANKQSYVCPAAASASIFENTINSSLDVSASSISLEVFTINLNGDASTLTVITKTELENGGQTPSIFNVVGSYGDDDIVANAILPATLGPSTIFLNRKNGHALYVDAAPTLGLHAVTYFLACH